MQAAEEAVAEFEQQRRKTGLPEARLLLAQAAILDGKASRGLQQARTAVLEFGRQQRPRWAALARFTVLRARLAEATGPAVGVQQLERAADDLAAAGWLGPALHARLLAGLLALDRGWTRASPGQLRQASRHRTRVPPCNGPRRGTPRRCSAGQRRPSGASLAVRAALRIMDEHRAGLGATDLRAHASGTGSRWLSSGCAWRSKRPAGSGAGMGRARPGQPSHAATRSPAQRS